MNRPYVVLGVSASIDGRISLGPNRTLMDLDERDSVLGSSEEWEEFYNELGQRHSVDAYMEGSNMIVSENQEIRPLEPYNGEDDLYTDHIPEGVVEKPGRDGWLVAVDGRGRLRSGYKGEENKPLLHLVSKSVSPDYLWFLHKTGIPYIVAGEDRVDLELALVKLKSLLGVQTVLTSSGGRLSGALLKKGLLDEVNIRYNPVIIGGFKTPILFASPELEEDRWPVSLKFISGEVSDSGHIYVRYKVDRPTL